MEIKIVEINTFHLIPENIAERVFLFELASKSFEGKMEFKNDDKNSGLCEMDNNERIKINNQSNIKK